MEMKKILVPVISLVVLVLLAVGLFWLKNATQPSPMPQVADYKNLSYLIEGEQVTLVNGYSEMEMAPGSASKTITRIFGNEVTGDLNGDSMPDIAFLITQEPGGSGTFFYVASALKTESGWEAGNAILLGDRIAPQPMQLTNGELIVNFADRKPGEPMTTRPTVGVSRYFKFSNGD